jgi:hypothetical protein
MYSGSGDRFDALHQANQILSNDWEADVEGKHNEHQLHAEIATSSPDPSTNLTHHGAAACSLVACGLQVLAVRHQASCTGDSPTLLLRRYSSYLLSLLTLGIPHTLILSKSGLAALRCKALLYSAPSTLLCSSSPPSSGSPLLPSPSIRFLPPFHLGASLLCFTSNVTLPFSPSFLPSLLVLSDDPINTEQSIHDVIANLDPREQLELRNIDNSYNSYSVSLPALWVLGRAYCALQHVTCNTQCPIQRT